MHLRAVIPLATEDLGHLSVNKLYSQRKQGGRVLNKTGKKYKRLVMYQLVQDWGLIQPLDPQGEYSIMLRFFFPKVYTAGYPEKAKNRHKIIDVSNFVKFFQDCVAEVSGVDDATHMDMLIQKREDKEHPRVEVILQQMEE